MASDANSTPAPEISRPPATDEVFASWWRVFLTLCRAEEHAETDCEVERIVAERHLYEAGIANHTATSLGGVLAKARLLQRLLETDRDVFAAGLAGEIVQYLEGQA